MVNTVNATIVKDTFNKEYNEDDFKIFISELLPNADLSSEIEHRIQLPQTYNDFIRSAKRIAKYNYISQEYNEEKVLDVLVVKLKKATSIDRARTAQRNFIARYLNGSRSYQKDAALVAFISEDENGNISPDWRFSLIQMNYVTEIIEDANGKKKRKTSVELTPAKRFSFLVGANEDTHTAQKQFYTCLEKSSKGEPITIEDLVQAFDIEEVSKEFFDKYKNLYLKLKAELQKLKDTDKEIFEDFNKHNINLDDFAKKTLGQLVFLYFIQKKGWLGVKKDENWGQGDKKFLRNLFNKKYCEYNNFFNDVLEHLFYEALATDRGVGAWFDKLNCRIPFLNGGLFEPVNGYEYERTNLTIDNNLFKEIFDTFDLYNFTVKEDEPLEKEVAIDPEMLGKVFENLLPENIRKGNGAFYTPREIVHYMCQESLINYLYNEINIKEVPLTTEEKEKQLKLLKTKKEKEQLKLTQEVLEEIISKDDINYLIKKGDSTYSNKDVNAELPESIKKNAPIIDNALNDIKVCDPAIGSGAFPVGMMNEIVRARVALNDVLNIPDRPTYALKRNAIENSIYGVDIDPGAVEIAKLRFWLSLVVDEEDIKNIRPLPNLDYKIMQGNSLITSYEGIDFDEIVANQPTEKQLDLFASKSEKITEKISQKQNEFLKTPYATKKGEIKQEIEDLIVELVKTKFEEKAEIEGKPKNFYEEKIRNFAQNKENRNFFPWKLFFADAFEKGGFDVVIGNPPYVGQKGNKEKFQEIKNDNLGRRFHQRRMDLFYFFFHLALDKLKNSGICSFITTNYYLTATYADKLRADLKNRSSILELINFNELKIFESALGQHNLITILIKNNNHEKNCKVINVNYKGNLEDKFNSIISGEDISCSYQEFLQNHLYTSDENYMLISSAKTDNIQSECQTTILQKIKENNEVLGNICNIACGVQTGADKVAEKHIRKYDSSWRKDDGIYVLNSEEQKQIAITEEEKEVLKPWFKNSDIKQYYTTQKSNEKVIYYTSKKTYNNVDNIKKHLSRYKLLLINRNVRAGSVTIQEYDDFVANKKNISYVMIASAMKRGDYYCVSYARDEEIFNVPKIVCPQRSTLNTFGYNELAWYAGTDTFVITELNKIYKLKYILALLNSKLYFYWLYNNGHRKGENLELIVKPLSEIPIKKANNIVQEKFINIVDDILNITQSEDYINNSRKQDIVNKYQKQIDIMVYKLYDLTYDEVLVIDKDFSLSEEQYNNYNI